MRNKKNMIIKCIIATFVFSGACLINTQNVKADTTLTSNKGITLKTSELKTTKVIKAPSDTEEQHQIVVIKFQEVLLAKEIKLLIMHINFWGNHMFMEQLGQMLLTAQD